MYKYLGKLALFRTGTDSNSAKERAGGGTHSPVFRDRTMQDSINRHGSENPIVIRVKCHPLASLFPNELIVRKRSVTIVRNSLMNTTYESMAVLDIGRVQLNNATFFASLRCVGLNPAHELFLKGLRKKDAIEAENVIESLMLHSKYTYSKSNSQTASHTIDDQHVKDNTHK